MEFGFLSILPAIVAITLAIATREVIGSLFIAIWLGATFLNNYNPGTGLLQSVENFALCQYLAGIFPRSRQINLKPPLTIAWDQPGTT
ncbi:MAG: hypothetical protein GX866_03910 [Firmicutes bacterium]|nr:hypothetical protein [Bacillota bacterium]